METAINIIVNGRTKRILNQSKLNYSEVILLAFAHVQEDKNIIVTATYSKGINGAGGTLNKDDKIDIVDGMIFNAVATDRT